MSGYTNALCKVNHIWQFFLCVFKGRLVILYPLRKSLHHKFTILSLCLIKLLRQFFITSFCPHQFKHCNNSTNHSLIHFLFYGFVEKKDGSVIKLTTHRLMGMIHRYYNVSVRSKFCTKTAIPFSIRTIGMIKHNQRELFSRYPICI